MAESSTPRPLGLEISCADVKQLRDQQADFLLLDCRELHEYNFVHIPGSTLLPMSELQQRVAELQPHQGRQVVVYCHHGGRSLQVTNWLRKQGFAQAQSMAGGIDHWAIKIDPTLPRY